MKLFLLAGLLRDMQHSRPPASAIEYVLVGIATVVAAYALVLAVRMTLQPGEGDPNHIKRTILEDPPVPRVPR